MLLIDGVIYKIRIKMRKILSIINKTKTILWIILFSTIFGLLFTNGQNVIALKADYYVLDDSGHSMILVSYTWSGLFELGSASCRESVRRDG